MPGPAAQAVELKRLRGNPGKQKLPPRALAIVEPVTRDLVPPQTLGDIGAAEWRWVVEHCRWLAPSDLTTLRLYCHGLDRASSLEAVLAEAGYVLYTDKGYAYLNPAHGALATTEAQLTRWSSLLGLNPSDRGRLGVAEVKAMSKLEEIRARRA